MLIQNSRKNVSQRLKCWTIFWSFSALHVFVGKWRRLDKHSSLEFESKRKLISMLHINFDCFTNWTSFLVYKGRKSISSAWRVWMFRPAPPFSCFWVEGLRLLTIYEKKLPLGSIWTKLLRITRKFHYYRRYLKETNLEIGVEIHIKHNSLWWILLQVWDMDCFDCKWSQKFTVYQVKRRCHNHFQHVFTAWSFIFNFLKSQCEITKVLLHNFFFGCVKMHHRVLLTKKFHFDLILTKVVDIFGLSCQGSEWLLHWLTWNLQRFEFSIGIFLSAESWNVLQFQLRKRNAMQ